MKPIHLRLNCCWGEITTLDPRFRRERVGNSGRMQVMTVGILRSPQQLSSSRRRVARGFQTACGLPVKRLWRTRHDAPCKGGSSVFHRAPDEFDIDKYKATERLSLKIR
jgi:hypothetical protein